MNISFVYVVFLFMSLLGGYEKDDLAVMQDFDRDKYLGEWYCIARSENRFEKDLQYATFVYSAREDGHMDVHYKGFDMENGNWHHFKSLAVYKRKPHDMKLYSGPFIGTRHRVEYVDPDYNVAIVTGHGKGDFWILARTPEITEPQKKYLIDIASARVTDISGFEYVTQD